MSVLHESPAASPVSFRPFFEAVLARARLAADRFGDGWKSFRQERRVARLPDRLRYDIGEIDHLPPPRKPLGEIQIACHQSPHWMRARCP